MATVVINPGTLTNVDGTVYQSAAWTQMLSHFGVSQIIIDSAVSTPDSTNSQNLWITGNVQIFSIALTNVELYLDLSVPQSLQFQFSGTFPSLSLSTLLDRQLLPAAGMFHLDELLNIAFPSMNVIYDSGDDTLYFGSIKSTAQLTALSSNGLALTNVGFEFLRVYNQNQITFVLSAVIALGSTQINTRTQVPMGGALAASNWSLSISTTLQLGSGLSDLVTFLSGTNIGQELGIASFHNLFPDVLHAIPTIFIETLNFQFNPFAGTFSSLLLQFTTVHPFVVGDNLFSIDNIGARLMFDLVSKNVVTTLMGSVQFKGDDSIDVAVTLPADLKNDNWTFTLDLVLYLSGLADIAGLPISTPLGDLQLPNAMLSITDLRLNTFEVDFNPINGTIASIQIAVALYASCQIGELTISNPTISLSLTNPFSNSTLPTKEIDGAITGTIGVDTLNFDLSATKLGNAWSFTGQSEPGAIAIGDFLTALANQFNIQLPNFVAGIELDSIALTFNSQGNDPSSGTTSYSDTVFTCSGKIPLQSTELDITIRIEVSKSGTSYTRTLSGTLTLGSRVFTLLFSDSNTSDYFVASYVNGGGDLLNIHDELAIYLPSEIAQAIPQGLEIDFKDLLLLYSKQVNAGVTTTTFLLGMDIGVTLPSLSNLPLVGQALPDTQSISINNIQMLVASQAIPQTSLATLPLPTGITLPALDLSAGLLFSTTLNVGGTPQTLSFQVGGTSTPPPSGMLAVSATNNQTAAQNARWYSLQKSFGPVHFERIGVKYQDGAIWFLLDAALTAAGLTISLEGLALGSPLNKFDPLFSLSGLGLGFTEGPIAIDGAFLPVQVGNPAVTEYDGEALIKTEELTLAALGSYATLNGQPSMFLYAVLDDPLGGPAFFYVTGLVAGFGYNRSLTVPAVDQVAQFPLVTAAVNGVSAPKNTSDVLSQLTALDQYLSLDIGANFLAIGIKFTSFKIVDSFALLLVLFGNQFEIDVLGLSTMVHPPHIDGEPAVPALAVVQMELKASFIPSQGFLGVSAQLTSASFLLDPACHLTGGFAFYSWFSGIHAGDFVQTLGGYHPAFTIPDHYPRVPRLGYNWQINNELSIKGQAYYALTASALMAGLQIQATWVSGNLNAWFNMDVDFLIAWKPYHYDAYASADMGVGYTFHLFGTHHLTFDIGANMHLWGPDFSGTAHIKLSVVSFDITFGQGQSQQPALLNWAGFQQSFLAADATICGVSVSNGLVTAGQGSGDLGILNPKDFTIVANSAIPSSHAHIISDLAVQTLSYTQDDAQNAVYVPFTIGSGSALTQTPPTGALTQTLGTPGVAPMGVTAGQFSSTYTVSITRGSAPEEKSFAFTPVLKDMPMGLWGQAAQTNPNAPRFVANTLAGFEIRPAVPPVSGGTTQIARAKLLTDPEVVANAYAWTTTAPFQSQTLTDAAARETISTTIASSAVETLRQQMCAALGIPADIELDQTAITSMTNAFLVSPQIAKV